MSWVDSRRPEFADGFDVRGLREHVVARECVHAPATEPRDVARERGGVAADVDDGACSSAPGWSIRGVAAQRQLLRYTLVHTGTRWVQDHDVSGQQMRQRILDARGHGA